MQTETAVILANLPPDTEITVTVKLRDWLAAKAATAGGPEYAEAADVARVLGFSAKYWVVRARAGKIAGARQDGPRGRWRLPLAACREHIRGMGAPRRAAPFTPVILRGRPRVPKRATSASPA